MAKKQPVAKPSQTNKLRIRMYCQGLGDCFLLTFPRTGSGRKEFHVLIDCGVIVGQPDGPAKIRQVAAHLAETTNAHIDVLAVTHEHWDHLSGFVDAKEDFEKIKFDQVWLSWMENPEEPVAVTLQAERDAKKQKLAMALDRDQIRLGVEGKQPDAERFAGLAVFFGLEPGTAVKSMSDDGEGMDRGRTGAALNFVNQTTDDRWFLEPGSEPFTIDGLKGIEFFVLGPPLDDKAIKKDKPTKKGDEVFRDAHAASEHGLEALAALDLPDDADQADGAHLPFASQYGVSLEQALDDPFYRQMYDDGTDEPHPAEWQRIDDLWMFSASEFALQLDADTNNTSLVMAIRLPSDKVLLFPGDAQVGNWESWHSRKYKWGAQDVEAQHLLQKTIVYKVGHHGSHNATLRDKGLMMMDDPDLTALLPVDEKVAHEKKHWNDMPFSPMLKEPKSRTQGRILRPDHDLKHSDTDPADKSVVSWVASEETVVGMPNRSLYLDYFVPLK
ncbi:MAG: hypothetical protein WCJ09_13705 [Planctomycetota bacterium]